MRTRTALLALGLLLSAIRCASAQSKDLAGIAHVAFRVANLDRSREFYESLGFEKAFEFEDGGKVTELFIKVNDRQFIELYPRSQDSQSVGFMHVCFDVDDIESLRKAYLNQGLSPPDAKKFRAGNLLFVLHDPEGQLVEYTQYLPGSLHEADRGQHLGSKRISTRLLGASTPVKDRSLEHGFYSGKLGFTDTDSGAKLRLPGDSGDELDLKTAATWPASDLTFAVTNTKSAAEGLEKRGLKPNVQHDSVSVSDPDGTLIIFRAAHRN
jgi:catechol 2,3-dioxygenase-like lactoylglutathione lyase family enzyme